MPIYEYVCKKCDTRFEVLHRGSDSQKSVCPRCKADKIERVLSVFGFSSGGKFKGSASKSSCLACTSKSCDTCR